MNQLRNYYGPPRWGTCGLCGNSRNTAWATEVAGHFTRGHPTLCNIAVGHGHPKKGNRGRRCVGTRQK